MRYDCSDESASTRVEEGRERVEHIAILCIGKCQSVVKCLSYPSPFVGYYRDCDSGGQRAQEAGRSEGDLVTVPCLRVKRVKPAGVNWL